MRISDWSSDVCSSDLEREGDDVVAAQRLGTHGVGFRLQAAYQHRAALESCNRRRLRRLHAQRDVGFGPCVVGAAHKFRARVRIGRVREVRAVAQPAFDADTGAGGNELRSEEHTSELQSLMRISYAVFCLKKNKRNNKNLPNTQ